MTNLKPITTYVHEAGPNPYKVIIVLEELGIPYEAVVVKDPKAEWFTAINPNGRLPAIVDPNSNINLWESGAIVEYLVETYDNQGKLTVQDVAGKWHLKQYLHFQMSGQGPYYGQSMWFHRLEEDIPVAKQRYNEQIVRFLEVLDTLLKDKEYLVGDKLTYADLSFVPWNRVIQGHPILKAVVWEAYEIEKKYPSFFAWHQRLVNLPSVQRSYKAW